LPMLAKKTKEKFISWAFDSCNTFPMSFDLWMLKRVNTFFSHCSFLNHKWEPCQCNHWLAWSNKHIWDCHGPPNEWNVDNIWIKY
jgi:hypothetical protein